MKKNNTTVTTGHKPEEPEVSPSPRKVELKTILNQWSLPLFGLLILSTLLADWKFQELEHPWLNGIKMCDSSERIQNPVQKEIVLEKGGTILREQIALHPYHARIWMFYGRYFMLKEKWDSCIYANKQALILGAGSTVNSIEDMALQGLNHALSLQLNPNYSQKETALKMIDEAEVPGYKNDVLTKLRGVVYARSGEYQTAEKMLLNYVDAKPQDAEGFGLLANIYHYEGREAEAIECMNKSQKMSTTNPKLEVFNQNISH